VYTYRTRDVAIDRWHGTASFCQPRRWARLPPVAGAAPLLFRTPTYPQK